MTDNTPRVLIDDLMFPEGPRWHEGRLWISDQHAHRVLAVDLEGRSEVIAQIDDMPSGLGWMPDGTLLVVSMRKRKILRMDPAGTSLHADLSGFFHQGFLNDMVVDSRGRAYVGHRRTGLGQPTDEPEWVLLVEPDGTYRVAAQGVEGPNGSVISADGQTLILAETRGARLTAFHIARDGSLHGSRTFAQLHSGARPDGICLDAEGAVWTGCDGACLRVQDGGKVSDAIEMTGGRTAVACMLGGLDRRTLFILATRFTMDDLRSLRDAESDAHSPARGRVEALKVAIPGVGSP